jgi:adenosylmethionine-8-amino-7-oxononanoate aminotransferase
MNEPLDWLARDARYLIHPQHDAERVAHGHVWQKGSGIVLTDTSGQEFLDGLAGLWNVISGYDCRALIEAATDQLQKLPFASLYAGQTHPAAIQLSERIAELSYPSIEKFYFTTSGAEANEAAIKTARLFWRRRNRPDKSIILSLTDGYHGTTLGALAATGSDRYQEPFGPRLPGFVHFEGFEQDGFVDRLIETIQRESPDRIAALILEPVQATAGTWSLPAEDWRRVRQVCDQAEILLIADEVVTAWGRVGGWFALDEFGIAPDLVTFAKGLTSGYVPLGGLGIADRVAEVVFDSQEHRPWLHGQTSSGHPVSCAVALAQLKLLADGGLMNEAQRLAMELPQALVPLKTHPAVTAIRTAGSLAAVEVSERLSPNQISALPQSLARRGLITRTRGRTIHLAPAYVAETAQLRRIIAIIEETLDACLEHNDLADR